MKRRKPGTTKRKSAKKRQLGKYKSGLEKNCADMLREARIEFDYEKLEFELIKKFRHEGVYFKMTPKAKEMKDRTNSMILSIKYTPDFVAKDGSWIIETKGYTPSHHDFTMRWKLFLKHLNELDEPLPMLFICKNKQQVAEAIQIIKNGGTK